MCSMSRIVPVALLAGRASALRITPGSRLAAVALPIEAAAEAQEIAAALGLHDALRAIRRGRIGRAQLRRAQ